MLSRSTCTTSAASGVPSARRPSRLYRAGITAGLVGGAVIAIWFLMLDTLAGRPLYTPSVLGSALFMGREGLLTLQDDPVSLGMVAAFSCVHKLVFAANGYRSRW